MPKTPPTVSLIGISLIVLSLATGSWLSSTDPIKATVDWPTDIPVDVREDVARVDQDRMSAPDDGDCNAPPQSRIASGIRTT